MWGAVARGVGGAVLGEVAVTLVSSYTELTKVVKSTIKNTENSFSSAFSKIGKIVATAFSAKVVWDFGKASVNAASQAQSAWTGLYSIVDGTGKSFAEAKGFIEEYISDGLVPLSNATTAYKNLAARGYSTEQIEGTLTALKDAASFGRQASYSLGDAITSATEGLKNENSILVDNAGVTKNVAKMWDEYAASIGTTANNLTQAQKIQAEYNGIMQETKFQTGDAATYANTFAGRTAQLSTAFLNLKTAVGKVVAPIASTFIPVIVSAMNALTRFFNKIQQVLSVFGFKWQDVVTKNSSGIAGIGDSASSAADGIGSIGDSAEKTAKKMKRALGGMDELNVLNFNKDSGSSSGSSGIGGADSIGSSGVGSLFDNTITEDPISPQIQKIADKIKKYLEPLKQISLDNLVTAFEGLKTALQPLGDKVGAGLEWLWFNVLVPLTTWTVEDALPAFINVLGGAFTTLNGVLDVVKPHLEWLWNQFLQPIASWTGGIIVDTLNWIGEKLTSLGTWLSKNSGKIYDALEPIRSIIEKIGELVSVLWENILKPVLDWLVKTLAPVVTPLIEGLGNTFEIVFDTIWNVLKGIWGRLEGFLDFLIGVFSGDWKRAWDGVKGIFISVWDIIKSLFTGIVDWFKNKINTLINFFAGLWQSIKNIFSGVGSWFGNIFTSAWNNIKKVFSSVGSFFSGIWNTIKNVFTGIGTKIGDAVGGAFKKAINSVMATIENVVNTPIKAINSLIGVINKVPGINLGRLSTFNLPRLAEGGWVAANNPQLALIGDNKREGEIVTPESKIYDQVSKAIQDNGGTGTQQLEITIYHKYEDGRTVIQKINQAQIDAGEVLLLT